MVTVSMLSGTLFSSDFLSMLSGTLFAVLSYSSHQMFSEVVLLSAVQKPLWLKFFVKRFCKPNTKVCLCGPRMDGCARARLSATGSRMMARS